jgi:hypothetical protein
LLGWKEGWKLVRKGVSAEGKKGRKFVIIEGRTEGSLRRWKEGRKLVRKDGI